MSERKAAVGQLVDKLSKVHQEIGATIEYLSIYEFDPPKEWVTRKGKRFSQRFYEIGQLIEKIESLPEPPKPRPDQDDGLSPEWTIE